MSKKFESQVFFRY